MVTTKYMKKKPSILLILLILVVPIIYFVLKNREISSKNIKQNSIEKYAFFASDKNSVLSLDNQTSIFSIKNTNIHTVSDTSLTITMFNFENQCIYYHNFYKKELLKKVCLEAEGPNGIGGSYAFNGLISLGDSLIFWSQRNRKVYLIDKNAKVTNSHVVNSMPTKDKFSQFGGTVPYVTTGTPMTYLNDKLYFTGLVTGEGLGDDSLNRPSFMSFDLKTKEIKYLQGYPRIYDNGDWGSFQYRIMYICYNKISNEFVFSFPASHYIYTYNPINNKRRVIYAGSKNITEIKSKDSYFNGGMNENLRHFFKNPSYDNIIYDEYRKMYYRIVSLPSNPDCSAKDMELPVEQRCPKKLSLLIMNEHFEIVGESELPKKYFYLNNYFVDKQGLWIADPLQKTEDLLKFELFEIKAK